MNSIAMSVCLALTALYPTWDIEGTLVILEQEVEIVDIDGDGVPIAFATYMGIGVNFDFLNLPVWAQEALIAHEIGHVNLGHIYGEPDYERSWYYPKWGTADPRERDADLFAADIVGVDTMINMLNYAHNICIDVKATECVVETAIRAEMLRGQYCI